MAEALKMRFPEFDLIHNEDFENYHKRRKFLQPMEGFDGLLHTARTREATLESICSAPLLTKEQEQYLFRQYNCLKYAANLLRQRGKDREKLARLHERVKEVSDVLCMCNMRLATSQLKGRHLLPDQFDIQLSHVQESVLRAINKFDYARGNKFSTYCVWAIKMNLCRTIPAEQNGRAIYTDEYPVEPLYEPDVDGDMSLSENAKLIDDLLACLGRREQEVIRSYNLCNEKETLESIGRRLRVTKERVRQIKLSAMRHLREVANARYPNLVGAM
jgi:RNA polymerase primary sigma factor